jgi:hypothetical protein
MIALGEAAAEVVTTLEKSRSKGSLIRIALLDG